MKIQEWELTKIKPYENNPRKNDEAVDKVKASIEEFGFIVPILIDENGEILAGHSRYKAAEKLKLDKVPVIVFDDLSENEKKKYRIIDNKTGELSSWDYEKLSMELAEINGIDMSVFELVQEDEAEEKNEVDEADFENNLDEGYEFDVDDFGDETFSNECPYCGYRWNE